MEWIIQPTPDEIGPRATQWSVPPLVAHLLVNRGISSLEESRTFLRPQLAHLHPPETLPGAERAAELICAAVRAGRRIVIYGDYDVDGIAAVAILWHVLTRAGANVSFYVPNRLSEGYGLNSEALDTLVREGAGLVVTVDCGVTAVAEARRARELGLQLIITDHHQPGPDIPDVDALVHPAVGGTAPNPDLCGAGVAFKLAWAVAQQLSGARQVEAGYRDLLTQLLPLAALGTVADVVRLLGENRVLARCGLARIRECPIPGLQALLASAGLLEGTVDGTDVGFKLAPRLNAAGRMGHARLAVELLTRADGARAEEITRYLDEHNRLRQSTERGILRQARQMLEEAGLDGDGRRSLVLAAEGWHAGVLGIVAARLVDRYHKPTVLITLENGGGQGSARSVPYFDMHKALSACAEHLQGFGGHAMAAGLRIASDQVPAFTAAFERQAVQALSPSSLRPSLRVEAVARFASLDERTVTAIRNLGPFGTGNPTPVLASEWVTLADEPRRCGRTGDHLQLTLNDGGAVLRAIAFGGGVHLEDLQRHRRCRVAFEPMINEFQGRRRVELEAVDFKFPE